MADPRGRPLGFALAPPSCCRPVTLGLVVQMRQHVAFRPPRNTTVACGWADRRCCASSACHGKTLCSRCRALRARFRNCDSANTYRSCSARGNKLQRRPTSLAARPRPIYQSLISIGYLRRARASFAAARSLPAARTGDRIDTERPSCSVCGTCARPTRGLVDPHAPIRWVRRPCALRYRPGGLRGHRTWRDRRGCRPLGRICPATPCGSSMPPVCSRPCARTHCAARQRGTI